MKKHELHDQEWRDFQPVLDPDSSVEDFRVALERAKERVKERVKEQQERKPAAVVRQQS